MQKIVSVGAIFLTSVSGIYYPVILPYLALMTFWFLVFLLIKQKNKDFKPQSNTYKELEKIKKKRIKVENNKQKHINDQIAYISTAWGYTKEQEKSIEKFVDQRAYSEMYNKLTASLFPQIITLIDDCNARGQKGCKREVSRRIRELTDLMKEEMKKKKFERVESFETMLEVYDHLLAEVK